MGPVRYSAGHIQQYRTDWIMVWVLVSLFASHSSWAAGTLAGTSITNTAIVSYSLGATPQPDISASSAAILVDEKIDLTVTGGVITNVPSASTAQVTAFTVTNTANSPLDFSLTVVDAVAGDNFNPVPLTCNAFEDNPSLGTVGVYDANDTGTFINELPVDSSRNVFVVCDIPIAALGDTALVGLGATARGDFNLSGYVASPAGLGSVIAPGGANTPNVDILFGDGAGTDDTTITGDPDGLMDATYSARNSYVIGGAAVSLSKTASVVDPSGGSVVMPGAVITYQITVNVSGSGTADNLVIDDPLPANTTYVANSIILDGSAQTDANDPPTDNSQFSANTVTVSLGNVAAPANHVITFRATIN